MSDRQTPESRLHAWTDPHASIVQADGSVGGIDTSPLPGWKNYDGSATRGAQYRDDQPAGVDNSQQAAQGSRVAAGVTERRADTCTLGTADSPHPMRAEDKARACRETQQAIRSGSDLNALARRLQQEMGYPYRQLMAGIRWLAGSAGAKPKPRCRYDWFLKRWVDGDSLDAVAIGGPLHGQRVCMPAKSPGYAHRDFRGQITFYVRQDYTHPIPFPQGYTALVEEGTELPPSYEVRGLAGQAGVIRWAGKEEQTRISCLAAGVRYGEAK